MVPGYRFCGGLWLYSVSCASLTKNSCNTKVVFNHFDRDSYLYLFYYRYILYISIYHSISFHHIFSRLISSFWPCLVGPPWPLPDVPGWRLGVSVFLLVTSCIASYIYYHLLRNIENILELLITNYSILLVCEENMWTIVIHVEVQNEFSMPQVWLILSSLERFSCCSCKWHFIQDTSIT